jgi:hypothetical protein
MKQRWSKVSSALDGKHNGHPSRTYRPFAVHQRVRICSRPVACSLVIIKNLTTHNDTRALWLCLYVPIF